MSLNATTLSHESASPFIGGATDQLFTKALPTERASTDYKSATFMAGVAKTVASAFAIMS